MEDCIVTAVDTDFLSLVPPSSLIGAKASEKPKSASHMLIEPMS